MVLVFGKLYLKWDPGNRRTGKTDMKMDILGLHGVCLCLCVSGATVAIILGDPHGKNKIFSLSLNVGKSKKFQSN
jgi:hypothetical protein